MSEKEAIYVSFQMRETKRRRSLSRRIKNSFSIWHVFLAIFAIILVHDFIVAIQKPEEIPYSEFGTLVTAGKVAEVMVTHQRVTGKLKLEKGAKEQKLFTTVQVEAPDLIKELNAGNVTFTGVIESTFLRRSSSAFGSLPFGVSVWGNKRDS